MKYINKIKKTLNKEGGEIFALFVFLILYYLAYHFGFWEWNGWWKLFKLCIFVYIAFVIIKWLMEPKKEPKTMEEYENMEPDKKYH